MNSIKLMARGLECGVWPLQARLNMAGFRYSIQVKERGRDLGNIAVVDLLGYGDLAMQQALTEQAGRCREALVDVVRFLFRQAQQCHVLVCPPDAEDVDRTITMTPGALRASLPSLVDGAGVLILVESDPRRI